MKVWVLTVVSGGNEEDAGSRAVLGVFSSEALAVEAALAAGWKPAEGCKWWEGYYLAEPMEVDRLRDAGVVE